MPGFNAMTLGRAQLLSLGTTKALGANAVNELRFSYMRLANNVVTQLAVSGPPWLPKVSSIAGVTPGIVPLSKRSRRRKRLLKRIRHGSQHHGSVQANNTFQWTDNFSKVPASTG